MEYVLWAVKIGEEDWKENVITSTTDKEKLEKAKTWAKENGYDRLRVSTFQFDKDYNATKEFAQTIK